MMRAGAASLIVAACLAQASAQPSTEHVTVTGTRSRPVIDSFVQAFAKPARMTGKFARWEDRICPVTVGLRPAAHQFVTHRVKEVAAQVGVPVNEHEACRANIAIVFTAKPQALLDRYARTAADSWAIPTIAARPKSWRWSPAPSRPGTLTATKDLHGKVASRQQHNRRAGVEITMQGPSSPTISYHVHPNAHAANPSRAHGWGTDCAAICTMSSSWPIRASWRTMRSARWPIISRCWRCPSWIRWTPASRCPASSTCWRRLAPKAGRVE